MIVLLLTINSACVLHLEQCREAKIRNFSLENALQIKIFGASGGAAQAAGPKSKNVKKNVIKLDKHRTTGRSPWGSNPT